MQGSRALAVTQQQAWDALNHPAVLKACIPGCDKFESTGENQYAIGLAVKIGPVAARFAGKVSLSDIKPPDSYTIGFDGQGGAAGFGKGNAQVTLTPQGTGCELAYTVHAQVGGKIAQLGQRLVDGAAKSMAEDFFKRFDAEMQRQYPQAYPEAAMTQAIATAPGKPAGAKIPMWAWIAAAVLLLAALRLLR
jgi:uncharacterized protein